MATRYAGRQPAPFSCVDGVAGGQASRHRAGYHDATVAPMVLGFAGPAPAHDGWHLEDAVTHQIVSPSMRDTCRSTGSWSVLANGDQRTA